MIMELEGFRIEEHKGRFYPQQLVKVYTGEPFERTIQMKWYRLYKDGSPMEPACGAPFKGPFRFRRIKNAEKFIRKLYNREPSKTLYHNVETETNHDSRS